MSERKINAPANNPESEPFYKAAEEGRFLIRRCTACKKAHWYPRAVCPFCFGTTEWEEASGKGVIYSYSPMRRAGYTIAYVTLAEGPTMMTNIVDTDPDTLSVGQAVKLKFTATDGGPPVPCFTAA
jgi:uncharacterized OB-fold protein